MSKEELIRLLQEDLRNEHQHMMMYTHAASAVEGLHREELREFFLREAHEELGHVHEFMDLIYRLDGEVDLSALAAPRGFATGDPTLILERIVRMEQEVADNYAERLRATHEMEDAATAAVHVFYEDQIKNSQMTAWEVRRWLPKSFRP